MNASDSITNFFWNFVPGGVFVVVLSRYEIFQQSNYFQIKNEALEVVLFLTFSLFVGAVFQGVQFVLRKMFFDNWVQNKFISNVDVYKKALRRLPEKTPNVQDNLHLMNHYVQQQDAGFLIIDLSKKAAFWGNCLVGLILLFLILHFNNRYDWCFEVILLIMCSLIYTAHLVSYFDAISKAFIMAKKRSEKQKGVTRVAQFE